MLPATQVEHVPSATTETQAETARTVFGGIFYLLNAALALELYADFTRPRGKNLDLSPWDWLAQIGQVWFGDEFASDPVWGVLARLAAREEGEPVPGLSTEDRWLREQAEALETRLHRALDVEDVSALRDFVCRHRARVEVTQSVVDVYFILTELPLDLRIAGLDRDPGWIPAAGRSVHFHFD